MTRKRPSKPSNLAIAALGVELNAAEVPVDFRIIPAGEFRSWDGRPTECATWICTEQDGRAIVADLNSRETLRVIDYEHATLKAKKTGDKAPAAGWFKVAEWRDDGVWLIGVEWTAAAAAHIASKEYRFISPVFPYDPKTGRVQALWYAALTNDPGLDGLTDLAALAAELFLNPEQEEVMNELLKKLLAALGLQETATEAEALSAVASLKSNVATLSAKVATPDPGKFVSVATLSALQGEHAELQGKFVALQAEVDGAKLDKIVADGLTAGKITPATESAMREIGKQSLAQLTGLLEKLPAVAKPGETQSGGKGDDSKVAVLSADQKKVCELLGIQEADYQKTLSASA